MLKPNYAILTDRSTCVVLTSSLVVCSEATRYEWNPAKPTTDHTEKKQIMASITVHTSQGK